MSPREAFGEFKATGSSPRSEVLLSSALASLCDAQAVLAFEKNSLAIPCIHIYGRLTLALQAVIKLIAETDKSSQPNPLLVPLHLRVLWTSVSLFHISLDTFLTNKREGKSWYRAANLCLMLHAVAQKFLFGKQHGDLNTYVTAAWDAIVSQVTTYFPRSLSSSISLLISHSIYYDHHFVVSGCRIDKGLIAYAKREIITG